MTKAPEIPPACLDYPSWAVVHYSPEGCTAMIKLGDMTEPWVGDPDDLTYKYSASFRSVGEASPTDWVAYHLKGGEHILIPRVELSRALFALGWISGVACRSRNETRTGVSFVAFGDGKGEE